MLLVHKFLWFKSRRDDDGGELGESFVWLTCDYAWVATVIMCLTELQIRGGQQQDLCTGTKGRMLKL